jgi:hypothetical protein
VIDTTDKATSRLVLERVRRVLLCGDPRDEHLGPVGDTAGDLSAPALNACSRIRGVSRDTPADRHHPVARPKRDGAPPPGRCQPPWRSHYEYRSDADASGVHDRTSLRYRVHRSLVTL